MNNSERFDYTRATPEIVLPQKRAMDELFSLPGTAIDPRLPF
jgi:hypothetical protein